jgi:Universal stress protein family
MTGLPITVGTDGSKPSLRAVDWAAREAAARGLPLRIVSVPELPARMCAHHARALSSAAERAVAQQPGLPIDTRLLPGHPAQVLVESSTGAAMLVVGSWGAGTLSAQVHRLGQPGRGHPRPLPGRRGPRTGSPGPPGDSGRYRRSGPGQPDTGIRLRGSGVARRGRGRRARLVVVSAHQGPAGQHGRTGAGGGAHLLPVTGHLSPAGRRDRQLAGQVPGRTGRGTAPPRPAGPGADGRLHPCRPRSTRAVAHTAAQFRSAVGDPHRPASRARPGRGYRTRSGARVRSALPPWAARVPCWDQEGGPR